MDKCCRDVLEKAIETVDNYPRLTETPGEWHFGRAYGIDLIVSVLRSLQTKEDTPDIDGNTYTHTDDRLAVLEERIANLEQALRETDNNAKCALTLQTEIKQLRKTTDHMAKQIDSLTKKKRRK